MRGSLAYPNLKVSVTPQNKVILILNYVKFNFDDV